MPGVWTINMTVTSIYGEGNSMTMTATVTAVDCSNFAFAPAPGAPICYGASANYSQIAVTSASGDLFVQPLELAIKPGFETDGNPIEAGQSVPISMVFIETNRLAVARCSSTWLARRSTVRSAEPGSAMERSERRSAAAWWGDSPPRRFSHEEGAILIVLRRINLSRFLKRFVDSPNRELNDDLRPDGGSSRVTIADGMTGVMQGRFRDATAAECVRAARDDSSQI